MKKNKGFTLVEVIVILVILAILAAVLIPSLTTYIDKAKEKGITANARAAYVATQAIASEVYGVNDIKNWSISGKAISGATMPSNIDYDAIIDLAQLDGVSSAEIKSATITNGTVTAFTYSQDSKTAVWNSGTGAWTVS